MAFSTQKSSITPASAVYLNGNIYTVDEQNPIASALTIAGDRFIAAWVNSKALKIAGITKTTANPPGGEIIKDADGIPTGVLVDTAKLLVSEKIPPFGVIPAMQAVHATSDKNMAENASVRSASRAPMPGANFLTRVRSFPTAPTRRWRRSTLFMFFSLR